MVAKAAEGRAVGAADGERRLSVLARVRQRGRTFEQDMPLEYLQALQRHYDNWAADYRDAPMLRLDTDSLDFRNGAEPVDRVVATLTPWLEQH